MTQLMAVSDIKEGELIKSNLHRTVNILSAYDTARVAAKYSAELNEEFNEILYRQLFSVNPKVAGRFSSLISEICTMVNATQRNLQKGRL